MTLNLNGSQLEHLHEVLVTAFPTVPLLQRMVRFGLDENLAEIAPSTGLDAMVLDLLTWAGSRDKYSLLIRAARAANPDNVALRSFAEEMGIVSDSGILPPPPIPVSQPASGLSTAQRIKRDNLQKRLDLLSKQYAQALDQSLLETENARKVVWEQKADQLAAEIEDAEKQLAQLGT
jgi:hypothetical protein